MRSEHSNRESVRRRCVSTCVILADNGANPSIVFEVEGELWAQPVPVQLFLETAIEIETRIAVVTDAKGPR